MICGLEMPHWSTTYHTTRNQNAFETFDSSLVSESMSVRVLVHAVEVVEGSQIFTSAAQLRIKQRDGGRIFRRQRLRLRRSRRNSKSWISSQDKIQLNEVPFQKMERTQEGKHMEDEWKRKGSVFSTRGKNGKRQTVPVDCKNVLQHHEIVEYDSM